MEQAIVRQGSHALAAQSYVVHRSFWSMFGRTTRVYAPSGELACFVKAKLMSFRGETTLFADEAQTQPLITMKARQIIGFRISHDIFDATTGARIGTVRNRGVGFFRDAWDILDGNEQQVGELVETGSAFLRRMFPILRNGRWEIHHGGDLVGRISERWKLFAKTYDLDLAGAKPPIDPPFAMACVILCLNRESQREQR